jgi:hypothetical protein
MCYRYTGFDRYLKQAEKVAAYLMDNKKMPDDHVPYWDFDAPGIPDEERDASAAAVMSSALFELSTMASDDTKSREYFTYAESILKSLSSPEYLAEPGTNGFFILKHSVGAKSLGSEIDVPLNYADYYFLESILRYRQIISKQA